MKSSYYNTNPDRFNPEFIGIANKYSEHKRKRINVQKRRKELDSDYMYTQKLDQSLQKTLQNKAAELMRLQQVRQRHEDDIRNKQQLDELRSLQIENLKERNNKKRMEMKRNIEQARFAIENRKKQSKIKVKEDLDRLERKFQEYLQNKLNEKARRYLQINQDKKIGQSRVNGFHRERNLHSLQVYNQKIRKQNRLKRQNSQKVKDYETRLQQLSKTVDLKKNTLQQIQDQIFKYKTDLKAYHSSTLKSKKRANSSNHKQKTEQYFSELTQSKILHS